MHLNSYTKRIFNVGNCNINGKRIIFAVKMYSKRKLNMKKILLEKLGKC